MKKLQNDFALIPTATPVRLWAMREATGQNLESFAPFARKIEVPEAPHCAALQKKLQMAFALLMALEHAT